MRSILMAVILFGLTSAPTSAQSRNAWAGAQVAWAVGDSSTEFADDLDVAGQFALQYWTPPGAIVIPRGGSLQVPFLRNIAAPSVDNWSEEERASKLDELTLGSEGIHLGIGPNIVWPLPKLGSEYAFTLYGYAGLRWNGAKDASNETIYLRQGRYAGGVELAIGGFELTPNKPGMIGAEVIHVTFDESDFTTVFGSSRDALTSIEISGILPITNELGVLVQNIRRLGTDSESLLRIGGVLNPRTPVAKAR